MPPAAGLQFWWGMLLACPCWLSEISNARPTYGSRNATIVSWAVITTYCLPSLPRYVMGLA